MKPGFGWFSIVRLGLVQTALGAIVVLTTSTLNRVMVVEVGLPAMLPGALVTLHHAMQIFRPRMGHGSDLGARHTPWVIGGMAALALGGIGAAAGTALMGTSLTAGLVLSALSFVVIGGGVSATGTSLLALMAKRVSSERRAAAATIVWMMMIFGFALTATMSGKMLDPFSLERLVVVAAAVSGLAFVIAVAAIWGVEGQGASQQTQTIASDALSGEAPKPTFAQAFKEVWAEPDARRFTVFVLLSMLSYSAQDLVLEPFAGAAFGFSAGETTKLSGVQHGGVFAGMLLVAVATTLLRNTAAANLKLWVIGGCAASAVAMSGLVYAGLHGAPWPLRENVFALGFANGIFSIAAIGSMMALAGQGRVGREGMRMGLWGAAQAIAFGAGGFLGTVILDASRVLGVGMSASYSVVFGLETLGFIGAAMVATAVRFKADEPRPSFIAGTAERLSTAA